MNEDKKKFKDKLRKMSKEKLVDIISDQHYLIWKKEKKIEYLNSVAFSSLQTLKFTLDNQNPTLLYDIVEEDVEEYVDKTKKGECEKSYA